MNVDFETVPLTMDSTSKRLPTYKFKQGEPSRIYVFPAFSTRVVRTHYLKGMGVFRCLSQDSAAVCCQHLATDQGASQKRKFALIYLRYFTDSSGNPVTGQAIDEKNVYFWLAPPTKRNDLVMEAQRFGDIGAQDFLIQPMDPNNRTVKIQSFGANSAIVADPAYADAFQKAYQRAEEMYNQMGERAVINYTEVDIMQRFQKLGILQGGVPASNTFEPQAAAQPAQQAAGFPAPAAPAYQQQAMPQAPAAPVQPVQQAAPAPQVAAPQPAAPAPTPAAPAPMPAATQAAAPAPEPPQQSAVVDSAGLEDFLKS